MVQNYVTPRTIQEAVNLLADHGGKARIMAGGTDLVLDIKSGKYEAETLVDITRIQELKRVERKGGVLEIGAGVTHNQAAGEPLVDTYAHALAAASSFVGSCQIRNCSTLAGNVVNAQPAADSAVALVALGASVRVAEGEGIREYPVEELYAGFGKSRIDSTKSLVTHILVPEAKAGQGSGYVRLQQRKALALPMLCVAACVELKEGIIKTVRIVMAPVGPGPVRAVDAEGFLTGKQPLPEILKEAAGMALAQAEPRNSLVRGSREYRLKVLPELVSEALELALKDAAGRKEAKADE